FLKGALLVGGASYILLFVLIYFVSKKAVRPMAENLALQKRFITDAGHELKTPLSVISANDEAIETIYGKNEFTSNIKDQVKRMTELVQRLLVLAKMEEENIVVTFVDFSLSDTVLETAEPFRAAAENTGKKFEVDVQPGITCHGDERSIRELVSILTDNAVKYCDEGGTIKVSAYPSGKKGAIDVSNTSAETDGEEISKLFGRFYRADESRSRDSGGFGLGLSIAQAITESHKGTISAFKEGDVIHFKAVI
ncbi:MAG: sensor histidine kinase, partial [Oscillospiraceae bacterium]